MLNPCAVLLSVLVSAFQAAAIDGTWELVRIFRAGPAAAARAVPIDSTVYVRLTLKTMPGGWIDGRLYRRYYGAEERPKIEAGPLRGTPRYIIGADFEHPAAAKARTAAWLVGDTLLHLGSPFVPDADSVELKRVGPNTPYPATVLEVVTAR